MEKMGLKPVIRLVLSRDVSAMKKYCNLKGGFFVGWETDISGMLASATCGGEEDSSLLLVTLCLEEKR